MRWLVALVGLVACGSPRAGGPQGMVDADTDGDAPDADGDAPDADPTIDAPTATADAADPDAPAELCPANTWCTEDSPVAGALLFDAWAVSPTDVFVVGDNGTILRRQNTVWMQMTSNTTENLRGVWAANGNDAWAVGEAGTVLRWNGATWSAVAGFTQDMG